MLRSLILKVLVIGLTGFFGFSCAANDMNARSKSEAVESCCTALERDAFQKEEAIILSVGEFNRIDTSRCKKIQLRDPEINADCRTQSTVVDGNTLEALRLSCLRSRPYHYFSKHRVTHIVLVEEFFTECESNLLGSSMEGVCYKAEFDLYSCST